MNAVGSVCVFCGSRAGADGAAHTAAATLGQALADAGLTLVYGGGGIGLMGIVARAALEAGGTVIGVIPEHLAKPEIALEDLSQLEIVDSMSARKQRMFELSDAFVCLPGGLGTLDETIEAITLRQLALHDKPVILVDIGGQWQPFTALMEHYVAADFADAASLNLYQVVDGVDEAMEALRRAPAPRFPAAEDLL